MHAAAVSAMIAFLTDSLVPFYDPTFIHAIRLHLRATLPGHFVSSQELSLSPKSAPPAVLAQIPLPYYQWLFFLGNQPITILASSTEVTAVFASRTVTLWRLDGEEDLNEHNVPSIARQDATPKTNMYRAPIRVPSLCVRAASPIVSDDDSSSSASSDCDSDDGYLSEDSMTSISSTDSVYSKPPATTYLYQGGKTNVVTGGVMLGAHTNKPASVALHSNKPFTPLKRQTLTRTRRVLLGPDSNDWRRRD